MQLLLLARPAVLRRGLLGAGCRGSLAELSGRSGCCSRRGHALAGRGGRLADLQAACWLRQQSSHSMMVSHAVKASWHSASAQCLLSFWSIFHALSSVLFCSVLFSSLVCSVLISSLVCSVLFCSVLFCSVLFSALFFSVVEVLAQG